MHGPRNIEWDWVERKLKPGAEVALSTKGSADWYVFRIVTASSKDGMVRLQRRVTVDEVLSGISMSDELRSRLKFGLLMDDSPETTYISIEAMALSEDLLMDRSATVYELHYSTL